MTLLLYFATYGSLFALFASAVAAIIWVAIKFLQALRRFLLALLLPAEASLQQADARVVFDPNQLKRAGQ